VNPIFAAALELQTLCRTRGWRFCIIGGVAVQRWGEPRLTLDVDLTLLTGFGSEETFVDALLARLRGRLPDAREFALKTRVLLLSASNEVPVDVSLGAMPFEERATERASDYEVGTGIVLRTCSAEDLVVHKVFAGRDKDWLDVEGIVVRRADRLDQTLIFDELRPLLELKGSPEALTRLQEILARPRS
jgi:hypothetical protein